MSSRCRATINRNLPRGTSSPLTTCGWTPETSGSTAARRGAENRIDSMTALFMNLMTLVDTCCSSCDAPYTVKRLGTPFDEVSLSRLEREVRRLFGSTSHRL